MVERYNVLEVSYKLRNASYDCILIVKVVLYSVSHKQVYFQLSKLIQRKTSGSDLHA